MVRKEKEDQGYHWAALATPVASWKIEDATSTAIEARSSPVSRSRRASWSGSDSKRLGSTDQSLTSSSGIAAMPDVTCSPWVRR